MAVYRFRVTFEDFDEVFREIDVLSKHTFLDLHYIIQQSTGYKPDRASSFYVSNDHWIKGTELAFLPSAPKIDKGVILMENAKLATYIDDPHQKFYYTYNFDNPFDFHVQLIKIFKEDDEAAYPTIFKTVGASPRPRGSVILPSEIDEKKENEYDFLNETLYGIDEAEDLDMLDESDQPNKMTEEKDEFSDEFSDNQNYEEDY
ncbi:pRiA4b ORF-3-like protein [bacterium A37T11]|nr:pRiA4b ORF-3-like protein [bacterium A37T11]